MSHIINYPDYGERRAGLCGTCQQWGEPCHDNPKLRKCGHPLVGSDFDAGFGVEDGEPFNSGVFATGPAFGCIHHQRINEYLTYDTLCSFIQASYKDSSIAP